jgi:fumarate reductase subunit C
MAVWRGEERLPAAMMIVPNYVAWIVVSGVIAWFVLGG